MTEVFLSLLNVSITATWVALVVLILRLCLKKAPKWIACLLWGAVGLRLILPFSLQSGLSLIPSAQAFPADIALSRDPAIHTGVELVDKAINPVITAHFAPQDLVSVNPLQIVLTVLTAVWLAGIAVMLLSGAISSLRLYRLVRFSVCDRENIYICDSVNTPFILGILRPRIFLPSGMDPVQAEAVLAHEKSHLQRKDHWWKPLGYTLLAIYWFNPLLWMAYILLCRDIELACDESVIKAMDAEAKKAYSQTLLDCSCNRRTIMVCPLAFGEVGIKTRIKAVLHYKKPAFWVLTVAVTASLVLAVCFLTDPLPCTHEYVEKILRQPTCAAEGEQLQICQFCNHTYREPVSVAEHSYAQTGILEESDCFHGGSAEYTCIICGKRETRDLLPNAHSLGEFTVIKMPAPGVDGERSAWCSSCGREIVYPIRWGETAEN